MCYTLLCVTKMNKTHKTVTLYKCGSCKLLDNHKPFYSMCNYSLCPIHNICGPLHMWGYLGPS